VACFIAWPWSRAVLGYETALRPTLAECVPGGLFPGDRALLYIVKAVVGMAFADAYNYWKHRFFHGRFLWSFHKIHHAHKNPSALGGYALSVAYGITTFFPIVFFTFPVRRWCCVVLWCFWFFILNQ
jgi:sterol desaturase/sphingolipid hydroxylase (fatty acid hydroxylase superfamily)